MLAPVTCRSVRRRAQPSSMGAACLRGVRGSSARSRLRRGFLPSRPRSCRLDLKRPTQGVQLSGNYPGQLPPLELPDHRPQRGRPPHGVKRCAAASEPSIARPPHGMAPSPRHHSHFSFVRPLPRSDRLDFLGGRVCFWLALAVNVAPAAPPPPPPRLPARSKSSAIGCPSGRRRPRRDLRSFIDFFCPDPPAE